jgi:hypothetical protein
MPQTPADMRLTPARGLSDRDGAVILRDVMFFLAVAFVLVALVVTVAVRY